MTNPTPRRTKVVALTNAVGHRAYCRLCDYDEPFLVDPEHWRLVEVLPAVVDLDADPGSQWLEATYAVADLAAWRHEETCTQ